MALAVEEQVLQVRGGGAVMSIQHRVTGLFRVNSGSAQIGAIP